MNENEVKNSMLDDVADVPENSAEIKLDFGKEEESIESKARTRKSKIIKPEKPEDDAPDLGELASEEFEAIPVALDFSEPSEDTEEPIEKHPESLNEDEPTAENESSRAEEHTEESVEREELVTDPRLAEGEEAPEVTDEKAEKDSETDGEEMYYLHFFEDDKQNEPEEKPCDEEPEDEEKELEPYDPKTPRKVDARFDFIELFVFTLVIVMVITSFFFRHSIVEGPSMEGTLYEGEHLIISDLFYTPDCGDIIVCQDHTTAIKNPIVKRVIALGGDKVKITRDGEIYVNDNLLFEEYVFIDDKGYSYKPLELIVPEGELFVMGDHRNESTDSRDESVGTISCDAVLGRVLLRFFPADRFGQVD